MSGTACTSASKENDAGSGSAYNGMNEEFTFQPASQYDFANRQSFEQDARLESQRRQSLAQLNGIRSKIGMWEHVEIPKKPFPKGVPSGTRQPHRRTTLSGQQGKELPAASRATRSARETSTRHQHQQLQSLRSKYTVADVAVAVHPAKTPAAMPTVAAYALSRAHDRGSESHVTNAVAHVQVPVQLNSQRTSEHVKTPSPAMSSEVGRQSAEWLDVVERLGVTAQPHEVASRPAVPTADATGSASDDTAAPVTPTTSTASPVASDASTVSITRRTSVTAARSADLVQQGLAACSPLSFSLPAEAQSASAENETPTLDRHGMAVDCRDTDIQQVLPREHVNNSKAETLSFALDYSTGLGDNQSQAMPVTQSTGGMHEADRSASPVATSHDGAGAHAVAEQAVTKAPTVSTPLPVGDAVPTTSKPSAVRSAMGSIMGAAWSAAGLWSVSKPLAKDQGTQDTRLPQQPLPADADGICKPLQPLQLDLQSPASSASPCRSYGHASSDSPVVYSTPTAEFDPSADGLTGRMSPDVAPLPCGLTDEAMAEAMPARGSVQVSSTDVSAGDCHDAEKAAATSLPILQLSPLPGCDATAADDANPEDSLVPEWHENGARCNDAAVHSPSAASIVSEQCSASLGDTSCQKEDMTPKQISAQGSTPSLYIAAESVVTPPTIEVLVPSTPHATPSSPTEGPTDRDAITPKHTGNLPFPAAAMSATSTPEALPCLGTALIGNSPASSPPPTIVQVCPATTSYAHAQLPQRKLFELPTRLPTFPSPAAGASVSVLRTPANPEGSAQSEAQGATVAAPREQTTSVTASRSAEAVAESHQRTGDTRSSGGISSPQQSSPVNESATIAAQTRHPAADQGTLCDSPPESKLLAASPVDPLVNNLQSVTHTQKDLEPSESKASQPLSKGHFAGHIEAQILAAGELQTKSNQTATAPSTVSAATGNDNFHEPLDSSARTVATLAADERRHCKTVTPATAAEEWDEVKAKDAGKLSMERTSQGTPTIRAASDTCTKPSLEQSKQPLQENEMVQAALGADMSRQLETVATEDCSPPSSPPVSARAAHLRHSAEVREVHGSPPVPAVAARMRRLSTSGATKPDANTFGIAGSLPASTLDAVSEPMQENVPPEQLTSHISSSCSQSPAKGAARRSIHREQRCHVSGGLSIDSPAKSSSTRCEEHDSQQADGLVAEVTSQSPSHVLGASNKRGPGLAKCAAGWLSSMDAGKLRDTTSMPSPPVPALAARMRRHSLGKAIQAAQHSEPAAAESPSLSRASPCVPPLQLSRASPAQSGSDTGPASSQLAPASGTKPDNAQTPAEPQTENQVVRRSCFPYPEMTVAKMGAAPSGLSPTLNSTPFTCEPFAMGARADSAARQLDMQSLPPDTPRDQIDQSGAAADAPVLRVGLTPDIRALRRRLTSDGGQCTLNTLPLEGVDEHSPACATGPGADDGEAQHAALRGVTSPRKRDRASMSPQTLSSLAQRNSLFEAADPPEALHAQLRAAQLELADLKRSNELLAAEAAGARGAVTDLLDRTSRAQVEGRSEVQLISAKLAKTQSDLAAAKEELQQVRQAKAEEKSQFRLLHEGKYLPLKKRCAAVESEVRRLEEAAHVSAQVAAVRDAEQARKLQDSRAAAAAAQASQQESRASQAATSSQLKAALADVEALRAQLGDAESGAEQSARTAQDADAMRQQLEEVTLSHDAMMQSRDRALAQASAKEEEICRQAASLQKAELLLTAGKAELERALVHKETLSRRIAGLQSQLSQAEKDRAELLQICHGKLAGIPGA